MILDSSVIVIKEDGTEVLTNVIEPGDELLGGATYEQIAVRLKTPDDWNRGWQRTDIDQLVNPTSASPVVPEVLHPKRPSDNDTKKAWWDYAKDLGYGGNDYEHISKAQLIGLYGDVNAQEVIGA